MLKISLAFKEKNLFLHEYLHINELFAVWCVPEGPAKLPSRLSGWSMVMVTLSLDHHHWMFFFRLTIDNDGSFLSPRGPLRVLLIPVQQNHTRNQKKHWKMPGTCKYTPGNGKNRKKRFTYLHFSELSAARSTAWEVYPWEPFLPNNSHRPMFSKCFDCSFFCCLYVNIWATRPWPAFGRRA